MKELLFYCSVAIVAILMFFSISNLIHFRSLPTKKIEFENRTLQVETKLKSNDINVHAPRVACKAEAVSNQLYTYSFPEATIDTILPVPYKLEKNQSKLTLSNNGVLHYFLNPSCRFTLLSFFNAH